MFLDSLMHVEICSCLGNYGAYMEDIHTYMCTYICMYVCMYMCMYALYAYML